MRLYKMTQESIDIKAVKNLDRMHLGIRESAKLELTAIGQFEALDSLAFGKIQACVRPCVFHIHR
jgi:hypothetical protein